MKESRPGRPLPFISHIPTVSEITAEDFERSPALAGAVDYWTGLGGSASPGPTEWHEAVRESWGPPGFVMRRSGAVTGFALYAPPQYLPRCESYPAAPVDPGSIFLADLRGDRRTRRHLLVRTLRDLRGRSYGSVEAMAGIVPLAYHPGVRFLEDNGWRVVRWYGLYALMRVDLGSLEVSELARELLERVRFPSFTRSPSPVLRTEEHRRLEV